MSYLAEWQRISSYIFRGISLMFKIIICSMFRIDTCMGIDAKYIRVIMFEITLFLLNLGCENLNFRSIKIENQ